MKRFISITLSMILLLNTVTVVNAFQFDEERAKIEASIRSDIKTSNNALVDYILLILDKNLSTDKKHKAFSQLSDEDQENIGDLLAVIYNSRFNQNEADQITNFIFYNLSQGNTSEILFLFAGIFLIHQDFSAFRQRILATIQTNENPDFLLPFIQALESAAYLDAFGSDLDILLNILNSKLRNLSYLAQEKDYFSPNITDWEASLYVKNDSAAARAFLERVAFFASKEEDSFWKGFITTTIPIRRPFPGRKLINGGEEVFTDTPSGKAHELAFNITHILIRHYILTGQDGKVKQFIEDQALRQGPFYFQFAIDGMNVANIYYNSLGDTSRKAWWENLEAEFVQIFKEESPTMKRLLVLGSNVSQIVLEYWALGKMLSFAGKRVITPVGKALFSLFPKGIQKKVLVKTYLFRGYVHKGVQKYLVDKPKYLYKRVIYGAGKRVLVSNPESQVEVRNLFKQSLIKAGYGEGSDIFQLLSKFQFNLENAETVNYFKGITEHISKQDIDDFIRVFNRIPAKYKTENALIRIRVINNKIVPEIEKPFVSSIKQTLAAMQELLKEGGTILETQNSANGEIFSRVQVANGTVIRFGDHEINNPKIHIHFEKTVTIDGLDYVLNRSFMINTKESLKELATNNLKMLWSLSSKTEQENFLKTLARAAKVDNKNGTHLITDKLKIYILRINEYLFGTPEQKLKASAKLIELTNKTTAQEAADEALYRLMIAVKKGTNSSMLNEIYTNQLLNKTVNRISTNMANEEATKILQWAMLENTKLIPFKGFHTISAATFKVSAQYYN